MDNYAYRIDETAHKPAFTISRPTASRDVIGSSTNYLVEVNSRQTLFKKPKFYRRLSFAFLVLLILLLITVIVLAVLYARERNKLEVCTSDQCLRSAANLKYSMDLAVDPCDNFYQYTCGHWSAQHPNHGWFPSFSAFDEINEKISIMVRDFLSSSADVTDEPVPVRQAKMLYQSCMDEESMDELGYSVVFKYLKEVGLPEVPSYFTLKKKNRKKFEFDWLKIEGNIKKVFSMDVFVGFIVDIDRKNISRNVLYMGTPGQDCPLPSPLRKESKIDLKSTNTSEIDLFLMLKESTEKNVMRHVLKALITNSTLGVPKDDDLNEAVDIIYNITYELQDLVRNFSTDDYMAVPRSVYYLQAKTDEFLRDNNNKQYNKLWETYINNIFEGSNVTLDFDDSDMIYVDEIEEPYLPRVISYLIDTEDVYVEMYLWWVSVLAMIMNTTTDMMNFLSKQIEPFYPASGVKSRAFDCTSLVTNFMSYAVSYGVFDKSFSNTTKPKVEQMFVDIQKAFIERVNKIDWMDANTKKATLEKTKNMLSFIGYPDWLFENGSLEEHYAGLTVYSDRYLDNMMEFVKAAYPQMIESLRSENKRTWRTEPTTVNAFNSFDTNAINIPVAILSYPVYDLGLQSLQYGAIGMVLGHEFTHGFDNDGRRYDKYGNLREWWTNETIDTFESKTKCFIKQYGNFTIDGVEGHVDGKDTLGENIADNGGLQEAIVAYRNYEKRNGPEPLLPGFENFTSMQLFFIAFGSIWCESSTPEILQSQLKVDEHSPNSIRVLATLQNSRDFADAFKCPIGSKMNPDRRKCSLW